MNLQHHSCEKVNIGEMKEYILVCAVNVFLYVTSTLLKEMCCMLYLLDSWKRKVEYIYVVSVF